MHRRAGFVSIGLFAALLALVLTALAPAALAAASASPSPAAEVTVPKGTPIILGVIPDPTGQRTKWSGDQINVNLDLNGAVLDAGASTVSVDDGTGCVDSVFFHEAQEQAGPLLFGTRLWWVSVAAGFAMTVAIETVQRSIPGRVPDERDIVANTLGTLIGVLVGLVLTLPATLRRRRRRLAPA